MGADAVPLLSSLFVYLSQHNFVDVIIARNLAEKTVKIVYFKIAGASSFCIQSYLIFTETLTIYAVFE